MTWLVSVWSLFPWGLADAGPAGDAVARSDAALFRGEWDVVSEESALGARPKGLLAGERLVVSGDRWHRQGGRKEGGPMLFRLDERQAPGHLDLVYLQAGVPTRFRGIYRLDGDTLTVAVHYGGGGRPTRFEPGPDTYVSVFQRAGK